MMMNCLAAGGLVPAFSESRDKMNQRYGDSSYQPNANGFFELSRAEYLAREFPKEYDGKLLKLLVGGLHRLSVIEYRFVFMLRNVEEIRQSFEAFFGNPRSPRFLERYEAEMAEAIAQMKNRRDVLSVDALQYRAVVDDPLSHFEALAARGWSVDPVAAAAVVDQRLCRFKLEELTVGI
jgi:hypothetical protein